MRKAIFCALGLSLLCACADPTAVTRTTENRPTIIVRNAPWGATFKVDGIDMGAVEVDESILVEPGKHLVEVFYRGSKIHSERVFVSGSVLREIKLPEKVKRGLF